jgi:demethoxyubiquinone hydroxylase (CLK1/Coq7/Cat5 family)
MRVMVVSSLFTAQLNCASLVVPQTANSPTVFQIAEKLSCVNEVSASKQFNKQVACLERSEIHAHLAKSSKHEVKSLLLYNRRFFDRQLRISSDFQDIGSL